MTEDTPKKSTSSRKAEANRRNAQRSTGPKTPEGKTKSSQNSITHGIFVKRYLNDASPEAAAEIEALAAGIYEHFKPVGTLEEILVQKVVVEAARYTRVLGYEQKFEQFSDNPMALVARLELAVRYTTSTSRALYRAIQELERVQAARKAAANAAASSAEELPPPITMEEQSDSDVVEAVAAVGSSTPAVTEDPQILKLLGMR